MYDRYFDGGGDDTREAVLRRAYALGVASVCDDPEPGEYDRLKRDAPGAYDESIVELAYEEGRARALDLEAEAKIKSDEEIWDRLVESEFGADGSNAGSADDDAAEGVPEAIRSPDSGGPKEGPPDRLDLPSFLRR